MTSLSDRKTQLDYLASRNPLIKKQNKTKKTHTHKTKLDHSAGSLKWNLGTSVEDRPTSTGAEQSLCSQFWLMSTWGWGYTWEQTLGLILLLSWNSWLDPVSGLGQLWSI